MSAAKNPTFYVYRDDSGELRWRLRSTNGKVIADSGEGYKTLRALERALGLIQAQVAAANTKYLTGYKAKAK